MTTPEKLTVLERLSFAIPVAINHDLLRAAKAEIERLEQQNAVLKSALQRITELEGEEVMDSFTYADHAIRIAAEALQASNP